METTKTLVQEAESKNTKSDYVLPLNQSLHVFWKEALRVSLTNPAQTGFFLKTAKCQAKAARVRCNWKKQGVTVPPIMIYSITNRCNLQCKGCYHHELRVDAKTELSAKKMRSVIAEAREMGISFIVLAGGEPLVRREILDITAEFRDVIFFIFTNGLLLDETMVQRFKKQRNIVPIISLEGYEKDTDERRGEGVYERLQRITRELKENSVFFGISLTLTRSNYSIVTGASFIKELNDLGCKMFFYVQYTPIQEGTEDWVITEEQNDALSDTVNHLRREFSALFISVPGDEADFGGCLSAGRGFIHISAEGNVEPCPFIPYSDANLMNVSLKKALQSDFLRRIRENEISLKEGKGGCALWENRQLISSLLATKNTSDLIACESSKEKILVH